MIKTNLIKRLLQNDVLDSQFIASKWAMPELSALKAFAEKGFRRDAFPAARDVEKIPEMLRKLEEERGISLADPEEALHDLSALRLFLTKYSQDKGNAPIPGFGFPEGIDAPWRR